MFGFLEESLVAHLSTVPFGLSESCVSSLEPSPEAHFWDWYAGNKVEKNSSSPKISPSSCSWFSSGGWADPCNSCGFPRTLFMVCEAKRKHIINSGLTLLQTWNDLSRL